MHLLFPLVLSALLFAVGVYGLLARRNAVLMLMSVELMLNAVNLDLVAFDVWLRDVLHSGQTLALFVITVAAAEVGLGLAIVLQVFRLRGTVAIDDLVELAEPDTRPEPGHPGAGRAHRGRKPPRPAGPRPATNWPPSVPTRPRWHRRDPGRVAAAGTAFLAALVGAFSPGGSGGGCPRRSRSAVPPPAWCSPCRSWSRTAGRGGRVETSHLIAPNAGVGVTAGTLADGLAGVVALMVCVVALLVQVYSIEYLHDDPR